MFKCRKVRSRSKVLFQATLWGAQQWKASEPLVTHEEPLAHQPMLCYANNSALYAQNDPCLPFLNKIDFILSFYCRLSCLRKAVIWRCLMVRVCLCVPEEKRGGFTSEFLSCVKRSSFFGAEFNEMINDPQDSHSQQGEKKEWGSWRLNRFTAIVCQLWSPFENVNCFWNMKSFFLIAERWVSFDVAEADRNRSRILFQVSFCIRGDIGQR